MFSFIWYIELSHIIVENCFVSHQLRIIFVRVVVVVATSVTASVIVINWPNVTICKQRRVIACVSVTVDEKHCLLSVPMTAEIILKKRKYINFNSNCFS